MSEDNAPSSTMITLSDGSEVDLGRACESYKILKDLVEQFPTESGQLLEILDKKNAAHPSIPLELYGLLRGIDYPVIFPPNQSSNEYRLLDEFWRVANVSLYRDENQRLALCSPVHKCEQEEWDRALLTCPLGIGGVRYGHQMRENYRRMVRKSSDKDFGVE